MTPVASFKTKKALGEYTAAWLNGLPKPSVFLAGCPEFDFLDQLLHRHHESQQKRLGGIAAFYVDTNKGMGGIGNGTATRIRTLNGDLIDFSWRKCVTMAVMTHRTKLTSAMRVAVANQLTSVGMCATCKTINGPFDVDHVEPFAQLVERFLKDSKNLIVPDKFDDCIKSNRPKFRFADETFSYFWQTFHRKHATLQTLCRPCHSAKTKFQAKQK